MSVSERIELALWSALQALPSRAAFYVVAAGTAFLLVRYLMQRWFPHRRISQFDLKQGQIRREFLQSMRTVAIFAVVHGGMVFAIVSGWTLMYRRIDDYGWIWFGSSVGVMLVMHDTYFYWTHRLMHHPRLFKAMHRTHHLSISTTPWAAYSFSPWEAFVQAGIAPLIVFSLPVHPLSFGLFMLWQMSFNVAGHCGYEIFSHRFMYGRWGRVLNTVTHHGLHHEKASGNFGLYFNLWDRLMGTNHAHYESRFQELTNPPSTRIAAVNDRLPLCP